MPANWNYHLFNEIVKKKDSTSCIFNLDGEFGFTDNRIVTFNDLSLINYFDIDTLKEFLPEGKSRILHYNKSKHLVEITPEERVNVEKIKISFENLPSEGSIRLTVPKKKSKIENAVCLGQIPSGKFIFVNRLYYKYLKNNTSDKSDSSFYLAGLEGFPAKICISSSPERGKLYGAIVSLSIES